MSTSFEKSAKWVFDEGIRPYCMFEPLHFQRMRGRLGDNQKLIYDFKRTRTFLEDVASKGYNQVWLNWWKGYGLEHEKACQDQVAELFPVCKELGLRPVCYHSFGSLTFDTLLAEEPDAVNWIARTQAGQPTSCQVTFQCFRYRPCFSSDGYLSYMEKVLARCIDAGADGIHFDNIGMQGETEACHCDRCQRLFREYMQERFGGDRGEELFGMRDFTNMTVPWFNQHNQPNKMWNAMVPHHRAWIDFKCHIMGKASQRLTDFVHKRNPDCYVEMNAMEGDGFAAAFWRGNDYDQTYPRVEMICDEACGHDGLNAKGFIIGSYRDKKWTRAFGCAHWGSGHPRAQGLDFAEDPAINTGPIAFWKKYNAYQLRSKSAARVAVLRERNSFTYNRFDPWEDTIAMEQYLIERRIPFDLIPNALLDSIGETHDVLIVAGALVMADEIRDKIIAYVKNGGSLILTGDSGIYDAWYRERRVKIEKIETMEDYARAQMRLNAFHELIGDDPHASGEDVIQRKVGEGRVVWIKKLDIDRVPRSPENWCLSPNNFMVPRNADAIDEAMAFLAPDGLGLTVSTNEKLYVHRSQRQDTGEWLVHLLNHEYPAKEARAEIQLRSDKTPKSVVSVSVDDKENDHPERKEAFSMQGNLLLIPVAGIKHHRSIIVRFD